MSDSKAVVNYEGYDDDDGEGYEVVGGASLVRVNDHQGSYEYINLLQVESVQGEQDVRTGRKQVRVNMTSGRYIILSDGGEGKAQTASEFLGECENMEA
jgi:hypothetical protein